MKEIELSEEDLLSLRKTSIEPERPLTPTLK